MFERKCMQYYTCFETPPLEEYDGYTPDYEISPRYFTAWIPK